MPTRNYINVIEDLARQLTPAERYNRLLKAIRRAIPCDAIALLRLRGTFLEPLAFQGLSPETQGRRFAIDQHPRLAHILSSRSSVRFASDSDLPDPYDGLIESPIGELQVHDCMGVSLYINEQPWGVITFDAMQPGQFDHVDPLEKQTAIAITRAVLTATQRIAALEQRLSHGHEVTAELNREQGPNEILGNSQVMQNLAHEIETVANTPLSVLIQGETGVGKEIVARHLHLTSDRRDKPFVHLNCAALPETLAEAELFGHTKGAFTGAQTARSGRFELADDGTLFLDEIGEMPLSIQAKLLRALQEGEIQRMGSDQSVKVDVRVVAATNRDLQQEVKEGRFRADLFHRLSVFPVNIPPLRERGDDILLLAEYFLERDQYRLNIRKLSLEATAKSALLVCPWHGNVRELEHTLSRAALKASREQGRQAIVRIGLKHLDLEPWSDPGTAQVNDEPRPAAKTMPLKQALEDYKRRLIVEQLEQYQNNVAAAARALQVDRSNLLRLIKRLGIKP